MPDNKLVNLSAVSDDAGHWTPQEALESVLAEFDDPEHNIDGIIIIKVGKYRGGLSTTRAAAKLTFSEIVAALELTKKKELED